MERKFGSQSKVLNQFQLWRSTREEQFLTAVQGHSCSLLPTSEGLLSGMSKTQQRSWGNTQGLLSCSREEPLTLPKGGLSLVAASPRAAGWGHSGSSHPSAAGAKAPALLENTGSLQESKKSPRALPWGLLVFKKTKTTQPPKKSKIG